MKIFNPILMAGALALATAHPAHADDLLAAKQGATFLGGAAAGVALGGPFGMVAGAALGAWYGEQLQQASSAETSTAALLTTREELAASQRQQESLEIRLASLQESNLEYAQLVLEQLQLEVLFKTDASELTEQGKLRLASLATFLNQNPSVAVQLDGYADPRGAQDYNLQLSLARVSHVMQELVALGVDESRIERFGHGAAVSKAAPGDMDAYALERAVSIKLRGDQPTGIAQGH